MLAMLDTIQGMAGIERKHNTDLLGSMASGRIVEQLDELTKAYALPILLIEGLITPSEEGKARIIQVADTGWNYYAIQNALLSFQMRGVFLVWTTSPLHTARMILSIEDYLNKESHDLHLTRARPFSFDHEENRAEFLLMGLPGVGPDRAKILLEHFGSPYEVFNAKVADLTRVQGIGRVTARKIWESIRSRGMR